jgi:hypothetical protein
MVFVGSAHRDLERGEALVESTIIDALKMGEKQYTSWAAEPA